MSVPHGWDTVTVSRPEMTGVRGTVVPDWSKATTWTVAGCNVQPSSTSRDFEGRALQTEDAWTMYAPSSCGIQAGDRISFCGRTFAIDGQPQEHRPPTGRIDHVTCNLKEWRG